MDDVGAGELADEQRQIRQLGHERAQVLDADRPAAAGRGGDGIDGHQPGGDLGVVFPGPQEPIGLDGLSAENSERGRDDRDPDALARALTTRP